MIVVSKKYAKKKFHFVEQLLYCCLFVFCPFSFGLYIVGPASITASNFPFDVFKLFLLLFEHAYFSLETSISSCFRN
jgi:hypothetical protein